MDASDLHSKKPGNLLSQIAADPEMINRPLEEPKPEVVAPGEQLATPAAAPEAGVVLLHPDEHLPAPVPAKGHKLVLLLIVAGVFLTVSGGGAAAYFKFRPVLAPAAATPSPTPTATPTATPSLSPTPSDSPTLTPTPSATPPVTPTPSATPAPAEVSVPAATPTADHPQMVTVTNSSGLWLRSSPSSASKKNIVAWMPKGAQVSVDSIGEFWWHGTYNGKTGYFAVSYTK